MALYEIAIVGFPTAEQVLELETEISALVEAQGMTLGVQVGWHVQPTSIAYGQRTLAVGVYFGGVGAPTQIARDLLSGGVPILPVTSTSVNVANEIPEELRHLNCLILSESGMRRVATAILECLALLPRQRRVFLSYKRDEARATALQLFDALSARVFDVFLDTHGIVPAENFQEVLWHRLCDCDVLVMLDTPSYFQSRWTTAEFGRALAKGISILRIGWPKVTSSPRTATASQIELQIDDFVSGSDQLTDEAISNICTTLEIVRGQGHAVRRLNMLSAMKRDIGLIGGSVMGIGALHSVRLSLPSGTSVVAYPLVGIPTSVHINDAMDDAPGEQIALVYDHIGLRPEWQSHLNWLGKNIPSVRWMKATEMAWDFGGWGAP